MTDCVDDLMQEFRRYDHYVDVVSIFQMLYEQSDTDLPATVEHFERYPSVNGYTPDFTVVFKDGTGLVGEIANVPRDDRGRDRACSQLGNYDKLRHLPVNSSGLLQSVDQVDVLFLTPDEDSRSTASRILEAAFDEDHPYSPSAPPCIVGYSLINRQSGLCYVIKDAGHPENGHLRESGRADGVGAWLDINSIKVPPRKIEDVKAAAVFMNDEPTTLYMATALWARVFPSLVPKRPQRPQPIDVEERQLIDIVHSNYGVRPKRAIRDALEMLERANYAVRRSADGEWQIAWEQPRGSAEDLAQRFAERFCKPTRAGAVQRMLRAERREPSAAQQLRLET